MTRRKIIIVAGIAGIAGIATLGVIFFLRDDGGTLPQRSERVVVRKGSDPGEAQAIAAVTALVASLPQRFAAGDASALASAARERHRDVTKALPAGSTVTLDPATWRRTGLMASMKVTARFDGREARFLMVVVWEDGAWHVSSTVPLDPS